MNVLANPKGSVGEVPKTPIERGSEARFGRGGRGGAKYVPIFLFGWGLT
jgi:hypothetical protein